MNKLEILFKGFIVICIVLALGLICYGFYLDIIKEEPIAEFNGTDMIFNSSVGTPRLFSNVPDNLFRIELKNETNNFYFHFTPLEPYSQSVNLTINMEYCREIVCPCQKNNPSCALYCVECSDTFQEVDEHGK